MDKTTEQLILRILNDHNSLAVATIRPDDWPQATTVGYANRGFDIYVMTFHRTQKAHNIQRDPRVSLINRQTQISGPARTRIGKIQVTGKKGVKFKERNKQIAGKVNREIVIGIACFR